MFVCIQYVCTLQGVVSGAAHMLYETPYLRDDSNWKLSGESVMAIFEGCPFRRGKNLMTPHVLAALKVLKRDTTDDLSVSVSAVGSNSGILKRWWYPRTPEPDVLEGLKAAWREMEPQVEDARSAEILRKLQAEFDVSLMRSLHCKLVQVAKNFAIPSQLNNWRVVDCPALRPEFAKLLATPVGRKRRRL